MTFDESFIRRVYRTTAWVWAVGVIWCLGLGQPLAALGLTAGALVGIASLRTLELVVKRSVVPASDKGAGFSVGKYALLKYPAYLLVIAPIVLTRNVPVIVGFVIGLGLVHLVIVLKAAGQLILQRMGKY